MKRTSPLWGSISILIGVVIAILSLLRGNWATAALIAAFASYLGASAICLSPGPLEWTLADPARFIAYGGTGRIRVYGIQDYEYADVILNR